MVHQRTNRLANIRWCYRDPSPRASLDRVWIGQDAAAFVGRAFVPMGNPDHLAHNWTTLDRLRLPAGYQSPGAIAPLHQAGADVTHRQMRACSYRLNSRRAAHAAVAPAAARVALP